MSTELYSMFIFPQEGVSTVINEKIEPIVGKRLDLPHITLGKPFHSYGDMERNLHDWLSNQDSFRVNFDTIGDFGDKIIYLTTGNEDERSMLIDLFYGIKKATCGGLQEEIKYFPHMTLRYGKNRRSEIDKLEKALQNCFTEPVTIDIDRVYLTKFDGSGRWKNLGTFEIGNQEITDPLKWCMVG